MALTPALAAADAWVAAEPAPGSFPLVASDRAAPLIFSAEDYKVVSLAVADLGRDIEAVTGTRPVVVTDAARSEGPAVLIGTLGRSKLIDDLVAAGGLDVADLREKWESFIIATVANPFSDVARVLVIVGSDRRGTAFGVYELSQAIGVSPWHWWADAAPVRKPSLYVAAGTRRFGPPAVKYRGIFINDEDWGLHPWAAKTFEPEYGDIGPKTYTKVFELLLRLKADTLWPAMHECTKPFNADPRNAALADDWAIVMGSSHAEPMLRNNVGEWPHDRDADYNYLTNRDGVLKYWEERVAANGRFENIYTLGMRGIHDSAMQGPTTDAERIATLERIFTDQRDLLARHVKPDVGGAPQIFCAYKEVLDLYRQGLKVPANVTIVWPDDNFGYVRNFASPEERQRPGGFGVYYHLSYLGEPLSYLWLDSTPPALIWEEMTKAYAHGADRVWIVNVGDIVPMAVGTEFFLRLAWNPQEWGPDAQPVYLRAFAAREFGADHAVEIARLLDNCYCLNGRRRPEHLQWWLRNESPHASPLGDAEIAARLALCADLRTRADRLAAALPAEKQDAFEELVGYTVHASALANIRYFEGELGRQAAAQDADAAIAARTRRFNNDLAGGKWRGILAAEPADDQWRGFRIARWVPPQFSRPVRPPAAPSFDAGSLKPTAGKTVVVDGLGHSGHAVLLSRGSRLSLKIDLPAGDRAIELHFLPTHPIAGQGVRVGFALDQGPVEELMLRANDGGSAWAQGVLDNNRVVPVTVHVAGPGPHTLHVVGIDDDTVFDRISLPPR